MPSVRCPRCAKKFKDQPTLLKHMNQPVSSCLTHFQELIDIANTLQPASDHGTSQSLYFMDTTEDAPPADPVHSTFNPEAPPPRNTGTQTTENPFRIKKHPTAGKTFGRGNTFMDHFDNDGFASARSQGYLYYPFAGRDEWELASFLLRSQMSLANIDRFLKLRLVSLYLRC